ncbi:uncharacterized protein LOC127529082 [Erpetoichthys calabaricus]|uniref:uncharacterized protein LOC127529082 n=1 Tax=Erpetoichthys calabaricus TaxID=27687 RepID=UPI0022348C88|nr:uncharacterized protein LOC127529082 [Erpetoichthys calabaricus]
MKEAYQIAADNSRKASAKGKQYYDRTMRGAILQPGDRVIVRNLSERGGSGKLRDYWEKEVCRIVERIKDSPVYKVQPEVGSRTPRILHRNLLLPVNDLPLEKDTKLNTVKRKMQRPARTNSETPDSASDHSDEEAETSYGPHRLPSFPAHVRSEVIESESHSRLRAKAREVYPEPREPRQPDRNPSQGTSREQGLEMETSVAEPQVGNIDEAVEPTNGQEDLATEHQSDREGDTLRRSARTVRPREVFTYHRLGQPSYQPWNPGVHAVIQNPMYLLPSPTIMYPAYPGFDYYLRPLVETQ